eukprot:CAMPEP_0196651516 /NCGR_PEP_ID=MMETSP1086-20130531/518_1 /TAXON_ID=77921 /ORGANISM="Cyanoptyche  gloeocystis , Strain SAG4.97" /LENGTH=234 /DNA_ID=CAMNT_0041981565 /DNA_START=123 /DNA_END=827 /DNA_ORIENTATION=+
MENLHFQTDIRPNSPSSIPFDPLGIDIRQGDRICLEHLTSAEDECAGRALLRKCGAASEEELLVSKIRGLVVENAVAEAAKGGAKHPSGQEVLEAIQRLEKEVAENFLRLEKEVAENFRHLHVIDKNRRRSKQNSQSIVSEGQLKPLLKFKAGDGTVKANKILPTLHRPLEQMQTVPAVGDVPNTFPLSEADINRLGDRDILFLIQYYNTKMKITAKDDLAERKVKLRQWIIKQ